ncbi:putative ubiquitin fusion degradation protein 2 putativeubiquitin conjugation factor E4 B [Leptomonas pyrrhocoris]|uniref:Putative ubiquitin fusion degradation protein 2 putativeubiquitin conjugation factor E4 B n=1 Tax=Leptomonas pyrrhocoris TaxID=157538 RepID=A0A0N0DXM0_LEPPY|nr:putative ubiquitin fusion degradation protein 2 putativeubiquitin conjugation factor E4 B [Leptomonas pyrrhocoris]KPA83111.1 putative ubiquitin fusion degradation protein 2 putativeubiquitin conjugation factor E4 B [Leptomonas pyrrhocoris]|eukprot:XP_015661550.1 putative ubiquitin fusion degradation protein 2 putativeubiquitin conjugation factor E4 B [Leptomonas pyrrhocoris]
MLEISSLGQLLSLVQRSDAVTVVDFYADWCGPCQQIKPQFEQMARYYDANKVTFAKCNVDRNRDCASRYGVSSIPTFIVFHANERITTVTGGDLGTVQRNIDLALGLIPTNAPSAPPSAGNGNGSARSSGEVQDPFAEQMLRVVEARNKKNPILEKDSCDAAYALLKAKAPYGILLLPYLASDAFSAVALEALFANIATRPPPERSDKEQLINQVLCHVMQLATYLSWEDMSVVEQLHRVLLALISCPSAQTAFISSPIFTSVFVTTGTQLERTTLLGVLFSLSPKPLSEPVLPGREWQDVLAQFPPQQQDQHSQTVYGIQQRVETLAKMNVRLVQALLRSKTTRDATLRYLGRALQLNEDYLKTMHHNSPICSRYFMIQLQSVLLELALPIFQVRGSKEGDGGRYDYRQIPAYYLLDRLYGPHGAVVSFGHDVERVTHFDETNPLPSVPVSNTAPYKPAAHLFFLAARVLTLCAAVFVDEHDRDERQATHPQAPLTQRNFYTAEKLLLEGLMGSNELGVSRLEFVNHLAHWLLQVMQVDGNGALPTNPPLEWCYLPQCLVDCVIRTTKMAPVDGLFSDGMISLMLVLMGNTTYFPKPHTHALFPAYLLRLQENYTTRKVLEQHPWFSTHIVRSCMECYITVEKSTYERVEVRYELSYAIKNFLKSDLLCEPVREEMESQANNTMLERFSHMAVAEVNEAVDQVIDTLTKMNEMMKAGADTSENAVAASSRGATAAGPSMDGGQQPPPPQQQQPGRRRRQPANSNEEADGSEGDEEEEENADGAQTYHQRGMGLRSNLMLFTASMDMFIELSLQFPKGVSQNMVAGQISEMLARSLMAFAGPNSRNLRIQNADSYNFRPREVLMRLVDCFTHFRRSKNFLRCLCHCSIPLVDIRGVMRTIVDRQLVSEDLLWKVSEMASALTSVSKEVDNEEAIWDDAPDFAVDALLSTPLLQPVALPAEVKDLADLVYVNKETLHHLLLSESKHPFTNEPLTETMVEEFNKRPDVAAAVEERRVAIQKWLDEAKAAKA